MEINTRFKDLDWVEPAKHLNNTIVGGLGGIGSWLALYLSRAEIKINVFEYDIVELTNLGGQFYSQNYVGYKKDDAIVGLRRSFSDFGHVRPLGKITETTNLVKPFNGLACFDSIFARRLLFNQWVNNINVDTPTVFIDGRMSVESFEIFTIDSRNKENIEKYKNTLFDDSLVPDDPCTMKATSHNGAMCASVMFANYMNFIGNLQEFQLRVVPYRIEVLLYTMQFKVTL